MPSSHELVLTLRGVWEPSFRLWAPRSFLALSKTHVFLLRRKEGK